MGFSLQKSSSFAIKRVKVVASFEHLAPEFLQNIIRPYIVDRGFFDLDAIALREKLLHLPWVHTISIRKIWPNEIVVNLEEQIPVAQWNDTSLFSSQEEVFTPAGTTFPADLPQLTGPQERAQEILRAYFAMQKMVSPLNYKITELAVDQHDFWRLKLNDQLLVIIGQKEIFSRVQLFVKSFPKIKNSSGKIAKSVDLRYKNGLAVKFATANQRG